MDIFVLTALVAVLLVVWAVIAIRYICERQEQQQDIRTRYGAGEYNKQDMSAEFRRRLIRAGCQLKIGVE